MFLQKLRKDKKGLSLVELVCAVAILSIITMTIGGAMIFATNSYRQGTVDTALQQEAQFTANAIESLLIDATDTVEFSGGVLTIKNTDFTYLITYDATEKTLRFTQHVTGDATNKIADNELLAEHVVKFVVDASNFATARNVILEIGLENGDSVFTTNYNITSRNDASAGDAPEVVADILCEDIIVLEPLQEYDLAVSVVGTADTGFGVSLDGPESADTTATVVPGAVRIKLGAMEDGGDDGQFRILISTSVVDSAGNPFTKWVTVKVRRVKQVDFSTVEVVSGTALTAGATYRVTATAGGTNLEEVVGASFDSDIHSYINPDTIRWSFRMTDGSDWNEWLQVGAIGTEEKTIEFTLKKDIEIGKGIEVTATALHPSGVLRGGQYTNKAARAAAAETMYGSVKNSFKIEKANDLGDHTFLRGDDFDIPINRDLNELIRRDWEKNNPGEFDPEYDGYNSGYTGNHHIRYVCDCEGGVHKSVNRGYGGYDYPGWKKLSYQGMDTSKIEFKAADLIDMRYMETYTIELVYSFTYLNKDNELCVFPIGFNPQHADQDPEYVIEWTIDPIGIVFGKCQTDSDIPVDLGSNGYLHEGGLAVGSLAKPLQLNQSHNTKITYTNIGPGSNWKAGVNYLLSTNARIYEYTGSGWQYKFSNQVTNQFNSDKYRQTGTICFGTVNNFQKGKIYKMVLGGTTTDSDGNLLVGQIYTSETGYETYSLNNETGAPGRGLIYFQLN